MRLTLLCLAIAVSTATSRADDIVRPDPTPTTAISIQGYGRHDARCEAWTDACVICVSGASGGSVCSTPGIACQPEAIRCTQGKSAAAPP